MAQTSASNVILRVAKAIRRCATALTADEPLDTAKGSKQGYAISLLLALACGAVAVAGLWSHPENHGREDWDQMAQFSEACRISIQDFGEFPWWNPWNSAGMPLAAHPACSLQMLLPVGNDVWQQLKVVLAMHILLSIAGAHALTWSITGKPLASLIGGVVYGLNGAAISYASAGHLPVECAAYFPWAVLFLRWSRQNGAWGYGVGLCLAATLLLYMHYFAVYAVLIVGGLGLFWAMAAPRRERRELLFAGLACVAVVVALAGNRVLLGGQLILENPRGASGLDEMRTNIGPVDWAKLFIEPGLWPTPVSNEDAGGVHEVNTYVGLPALALFLFSLRRGWRWWHTLTCIAMLLAVGNSHWFHPSVWFESLPVFSSMRVVTRWRLVAMLGLAIGCGVGVASIEKRWLLRGAVILVLLVPLDLTYQAHAIFDRTFVIPKQQIATESIESGIVQILDVSQIGQTAVPPGCNSVLFPFTSLGIGVVAGYEPFIASKQRLSGANGIGHPFYEGEFGPKDLVEQTHWSPNRIVLSGPPGTQAWVNQNRGSYWNVNDQSIDDSQSVVDRTERLEVNIPSSGVAELTVVPPLSRIGWMIQGIAAVFTLVLIALRFLSRRRRPAKA